MKSIKEVTAPELALLLEEKSKDMAVIDVRERSEFELGHVPSSCWMPVASTLLNDIHTLSSEIKRVYCICHHGVRSVLAAQQIISERPELDVYHVRGGVHAWSELVDRSFPKY